VNGSTAALNKLREIVRHEFSAAMEQSEAFVYLCEDAARFAPALPPEMLSARRAGVQHRPMVLDLGLLSKIAQFNAFHVTPVIIAEDSSGIPYICA
jgi:hypothetical protein